MRWLWLLVAVLLLGAVAGAWLLLGSPGAAPFEDSDQLTSSGSAAALLPGRPVGQTFVARHGGLSGIAFWLVPTNTLPVSLTLHLRSDPQSQEDLATSVAVLAPAAAAGPYRFGFAPQAASHSRYYYAFLEADGPGVSAALADGDAYLDGAAYVNHQPQDAQTTFRLVYSPAHMALDLLKNLAVWAGLVAVAGFLFVIPGWAVLDALLPKLSVPWWAKLGLAAGVSLAVYPLLLLWTDLIGVHLGPIYAWLPGSAGLVVLVWRHRAWRPQESWNRLRRGLHSSAFWPDLALLLVAGLVFGTRFVAVGTLEAPLWGDGYQHSVITQLLVDQGGLFDSWAPYADIDRFTYHFGFHSAAAALHWLTGRPVISSTLWTGQVLNVLAALALAPLALRLVGGRWGAVWAVLLAGLLSPMPMYYVNWGRYTQLAGQVILPAAAWLTLEAVSAPKGRWRLVLLTAVVVGGLALTHYRVLAFYAAFAVAAAATTLHRGIWREALLRLGLAALGAGLLFLPWLVHSFSGNIPAIVHRQLTLQPEGLHPFMLEHNAAGRLTDYLAPAWWLVALLGLGIGLWQRRRGVVTLALWCALLILAANPAWLSLPGTGVITNFALFIAAYLPAGLLSAVAVASLLEPACKRAGLGTLAVVLIIVLGIGGARQRIGDLDRGGHAYVTRPDVRAAEWIRGNTDAQARFLVSSSMAYGGSVVVGSDGGWWLPLLARRANTVPPLSYSTELSPGSPSRQRTEELARLVGSHRLDDPVLIDRLKEQGITHVYLGQRQGQVNSDGAGTLDPAVLLNSPAYRAVYHADRVWIFALDSSR